MSEIAIVSVKPQMWEEPLPMEDALLTGTIFSELNKPFFIEKQMEKQVAMPQSERDAALREIQRVTFFLYDLTLYLDTHPKEAVAMQRRSECQQKRKELLAQFAKDFYPLTMDCQGEIKEEPVPWEGGKASVDL